jgi:cytosine/adenosine deaminase-related metal-dependent hydrolase
MGRSTEPRHALVLRGARCLEEGGWSPPRDLHVEGGRVVPGLDGPAVREVRLDGLFVLPALVNAHDVLDLSTFPPLGAPPYRSVYDWTRASEEDEARLAAALAVPLVDRLFLGAVRNLLAGAASVLHHGPDHRSLGLPGFPVRVQRRYGFAHSPGLTPLLRRTYRTTDRRIPWLVRAAEGSDEALRAEIDRLAEANVLRQNTVLVHGTVLRAEDATRLAAAGASLAWCPQSDRWLYGTTAPAAALRAAGVRVGLGSDAAPKGARDALSNLAAARREGGLGDEALLRLATVDAAAVARLPVGGTEEGAAADLLAVDSPERLLAGDRGAIALLLVDGRARWGAPALLAAAGVEGEPLRVDGAERALEAGIARRLRGLVRRHPGVRGASWLGGVGL